MLHGLPVPASPLLLINNPKPDPLSTLSEILLHLDPSLHPWQNKAAVELMRRLEARGVKVVAI